MHHVSDFLCYFTLGVCPLTFPARARDPWTLPRRVTEIISVMHRKNITVKYNCFGKNMLKEQATHTPIQLSRV